MAGLSPKIFVALTVLTYGVAPKTDYEQNVIKHEIIKRETVIAANAVRNITIKTPQCKLQLTTMASDLIVAFHYTQYALNNVIANMVTEVDVHKDLAFSADLTSSSINSIEQAIIGDFEQLKEKLATVLDFLHESVLKFHEEVKSVPNRFVFNQLKKEHNFLIFGVYKLKYQAKLFDTPNKDLVAEMEASLKTFTEVINSLTSTDKTIEEELRGVLQHIATTVAGIIDKLGNWVDLNSNKVDTVKGINEAVIATSQIYDGANRVLSENHDCEYIKNLLVKKAADGTNLAKTLATLDYSDSFGEQEFIRSTLFDAITMGYAYADIINSTASKS